MKYIIYYLVLGLLFIAACSIDDPVIEELDQAYYPVESKTVGRVLDERGTPIADAIVELNGRTASTNSLGLFKFDKMELNGVGTHLIVRKVGFFNAHRVFIPNIPTISSITVYMISRPPSAIFQHNVGGTIGFSSGASVSILPNSIVTASGTPYTGEVEVTAYWLDPTDFNALSLMPGNLSGFSLEDEQVQLATYGMMVVELTSPTGEPLNIGNGQVATLVFPVGNDLLTSAPAVIPLWNFNEETGFWEEEGSANLMGTSYIAEVSHFSWWNCDAPFPLIDYEVCVLSEDGIPISGAQVLVTITSGNLTGRPLTAIAQTNSNGKAFGKIPKDEILQLDIQYGSIDLQCEFATVYTETIGPFTSAANNSVIINASLDSRIIDLSGNFIDCDGIPVEDGVIITSVSDIAFPINADGTVDFSLISCLDEIDVTAYNFTESKQSPTSTYSTTLPVNDITMVNFEICDNIEEFITMTFDGETFTWFDHDYGFDVATATNYVTWQSYVTDTHSGEISWTGDDLGVFNGSIWGNIDTNLDSDWVSVGCYSSPCNESIQIDEYDPIGGFIGGSFTANLNSNISGNIVPVTGSFRVKND